MSARPLIAPTFVATAELELSRRQLLISWEDETGAIQGLLLSLEACHGFQTAVLSAADAWLANRGLKRRHESC